MLRIRSAVGFTIVAWMVAFPALSAGQSRLFVFGGEGGAEVSLETGITRGIDTPNHMFAPQLVAGGRYLADLIWVASGRYALRVWSPRTGETLTPVEFVGATGDSDYPILVGDENRARAFVWNLDTISEVSSSGVRDIVSNLTPLPAPWRIMAYAPVAEVLFVVRQAAGIELAQYSMDGTLLRVIPLPAAPRSVAVTSDGRRIFTLTPTSPATLTSYDALTGAEEGSVQLLPGESGFGGGSGAFTLLLDEAGGRVLIPNGVANFLEVRSFDLALLQDIRYGSSGALCRFALGVDEPRGTAAVATTASSQFFGAQNPRVWLVNLATGALIASAPLTNPRLDEGYRCGGGVVVLTPPLAPSLELPVISGATVTLTWSAVRTATDYQIEAGPAPGATAFTARTDGNLSLAVSAVPPGTYYVRLRALK